MRNSVAGLTIFPGHIDKYRQSSTNRVSGKVGPESRGICSSDCTAYECSSIMQTKLSSTSCMQLHFYFNSSVHFQLCCPQLVSGQLVIASTSDCINDFIVEADM